MDTKPSPIKIFALAGLRGKEASPGDAETSVRKYLGDQGPSSLESTNSQPEDANLAGPEAPELRSSPGLEEKARPLAQTDPPEAECLGVSKRNTALCGHILRAELA